jgi:hypothetical protein
MFDDDGTPLEPARQIHKRGKQKKVNQVAGRKLDGVHQTESFLESNIVMAGEIDPRVVSIRTQPCTFDLNTGRRYPTRNAAQQAGTKGVYRPRIYTPDILFTLSSGAEVFVEGKHTKWLAKRPEYEDDLAALREVGHHVVLVTEKAFSPALVRNIRMLKSYGSKEPSAENVRAMRAALAKPMRIADLMTSARVAQSDVLAGVVSGILRFDLAGPAIGPRSMVELATSMSHLEILEI